MIGAGLLFFSSVTHCCLKPSTACCKNTVAFRKKKKSSATRWTSSLAWCVNPPTQTKYPRAIKNTSSRTSPAHVSQTKMWWILSQEGFYNPFLKYASKKRIGKGLHSSCSDCVLVDMARMQKILCLHRGLSANMPPASACRPVCLWGRTLRIETALILQCAYELFQILHHSCCPTVM